MSIIRRMQRYHWVRRSPAERALKKRTRLHDTTRVFEATLGSPRDPRFVYLIERLFPGTPVAQVADQMGRNGYHTNVMVAFTFGGAEGFSFELRHVGGDTYLLCLDIQSPEYEEDVVARLRLGAPNARRVASVAYIREVPVLFDA